MSSRSRDKIVRLAVVEGDVESLIALLESGADVEAKDKDGDTLLHIAAEKGHTEIVNDMPPFFGKIIC